MHVIGSIIIGLLAGAIAKLLMPGKDPGGWIITILLGLVGAIVGSYLGQVLGLYAPDEKAGFIGSVIGAMILLGLYRLVAKPRT